MVAGQALGGSTALVAAESDSRVKGLLTMDAMLDSLWVKDVTVGEV